MSSELVLHSCAVGDSLYGNAVAVLHASLKRRACTILSLAALQAAASVRSLQTPWLGAVASLLEGAGDHLQPSQGMRTDKAGGDRGWHAPNPGRTACLSAAPYFSLPVFLLSIPGTCFVAAPPRPGGRPARRSGPKCPAPPPHSCGCLWQCRRSSRCAPVHTSQHGAQQQTPQPSRMSLSSKHRSPAEPRSLTISSGGHSPAGATTCLMFGLPSGLQGRNRSSCRPAAVLCCQVSAVPPPTCSRGTAKSAHLKVGDGGSGGMAGGGARGAQAGQHPVQHVEPRLLVGQQLPVYL